MRAMYADSALRPGSSSSGSVTDWENGHNTILRRQPLSVLPPAVLERLSVRSELGSTNSLTSSKKSSQSVASAIEIEPSTSKETSQQNAEHQKPRPKFRNVATNLTSLTRELTPSISEVYHERNLGLGLAPSLSKLLEEVGSCSVLEGEKQNQFMAKNNIVLGHSQTTSWLQNESELCRRDEADGRSITDSQCSATSSNKIRRKAPPPPI